MKVNNSKINEMLKNQPPSGPVYAKLPNSETETITTGDEVKISKGQFGWFLTLTIADVGTRIVNVRAQENQQLSNAFRLEVWEALRDFKPTNSQNTITKGQQRVFAVPA